MREGIRIRVYLLFGIFGIGIVLLVVRLVFLQIVDASHLKEIALRQYQTSFSPLKLRGRILDRNGELLATSVPTYSLALHPAWVEEEEKTRLCSLLRRIAPSEPCERFLSDRAFVWVKRHLSRDEYESYRTATRAFAPALEWMEESRRVYPKGDLAGQLIGFVGEDGRGLEGLEFALDSILNPRAVTIPVYRDARRVLLVEPRSSFDLDPPSRDVVLTIDGDLQDEVEHILKEACTRTGAVQAQAIVVEVPGGEIRVAALSHSFNPNEFRKYSPESWRFRIASDIFEPGSTVKPFLFFSAQRAGVPPWKLFYAEEGQWEFYRHRIRDDKPHGWLSLKEMVIYSSNIIAAKVGILLGKEKLIETFRQFGFGERVGLSLPLESSGILRPPERIVPLELATISFGQGMGATLLQLARAYARLASRNLSLNLKLVENPGERSSSSFALSQGFAPEDARVFETTLKVLEDAVLTGTGRKAFIPGLRIGGKTGTSQKADPRGGYSPDRYIALFAGIFPIESPRYVVAVLVDEPKKDIYGGIVAAPVFREIALKIALREGLLNHHPGGKDSFRSEGPAEVFRIPPQEDRIPDLQGAPLRRAGEIARSLGLHLRVEGRGFVKKQYPPPGTPLRRGMTLYLLLAEG
jgi:cell division protein FtsI (penicillin-binding protein 3)